jgi:hypothetical protein
MALNILLNELNRHVNYREFARWFSRTIIMKYILRIILVFIMVWLYFISILTNIIEPLPYKFICIIILLCNFDWKHKTKIYSINRYISVRYDYHNINIMRTNHCNIPLIINVLINNYKQRELRIFHMSTPKCYIRIPLERAKLTYTYMRDLQSCLCYSRDMLIRDKPIIYSNINCDLRERNAHIKLAELCANRAKIPIISAIVPLRDIRREIIIVYISLHIR